MERGDSNKGTEAPMLGSLSAVKEHTDSTRNKRLFMKDVQAKYFGVCAVSKKKKIQKTSSRALPSPKCHSSKSNVTTLFHSVMFISAGPPALTITPLPLILQAILAMCMPGSVLNSIISLF